jgi:hypothetical protein
MNLNASAGDGSDAADTSDNVVITRSELAGNRRTISIVSVDHGDGSHDPIGDVDGQSLGDHREFSRRGRSLIAAERRGGLVRAGVEDRVVIARRIVDHVICLLSVKDEKKGPPLIAEK